MTVTIVSKLKVAIIVCLIAGDFVIQYSHLLVCTYKIATSLVLLQYILNTFILAILSHNFLP